MVIVAAIESSDAADRIVDQGATLAEKFDVPLHAVHVMKRSEAVDVETDSMRNVEGVQLDDLEEDAAKVAREALQNQSLPVESEAVGLIGDPADEILRYADEAEAEYIVVSPRQQSPTGKFIFGSVSQSVLLNTECPVVSVLNQ